MKLFIMLGGGAVTPFVSLIVVKAGLNVLPESTETNILVIVETEIIEPSEEHNMYHQSFIVLFFVNVSPPSRET